MSMISKERFTKHLAQKLQELRKKKKISQEELADQVGVYRTYIGHIENARYNPSAYFLYKVITILDGDPKDFFRI